MPESKIPQDLKDYIEREATALMRESMPTGLETSVYRNEAGQFIQFLESMYERGMQDALKRNPPPLSHFYSDACEGLAIVEDGKRIGFLFPATAKHIDLGEEGGIVSLPDEPEFIAYYDYTVAGGCAAIASFETFDQALEWLSRISDEDDKLEGFLKKVVENESPAFVETLKKSLAEYGYQITVTPQVHVRRTDA